MQNKTDWRAVFGTFSPGIVLLFTALTSPIWGDWIIRKLNFVNDRGAYTGGAALVIMFIVMILWGLGVLTIGCIATKSNPLQILAQEFPKPEPKEKEDPKPSNWRSA